MHFSVKNFTDNINVPKVMFSPGNSRFTNLGSEFSCKWKLTKLYSEQGGQNTGPRNGTSSMAQTSFMCIAGPRSGENHGILVVGKILAIFLCCTIICCANGRVYSEC